MTSVVTYSVNCISISADENEQFSSFWTRCSQWNPCRKHSRQKTAGKWFVSSNMMQDINISNISHLWTLRSLFRCSCCLCTRFASSSFNNISCQSGKSDLSCRSLYIDLLESHHRTRSHFCLYVNVFTCLMSPHHFYARCNTSSIVSVLVSGPTLYLVVITHITW